MINLLSCADEGGQARVERGKREGIEYLFF
jgi:hypothetical protein